MARGVTRPGKRTYKALLSRERILDVAAGMIEGERLEAFSFRKLAAALGCEAMSIYHYFPSKAHLFDALLDRMISGMAAAPADLPWIERLRITARGYRDAALRNPQFFKFAAVHRMNTATGLGYLEALLAILRDAGFDAETSARLFRALGYYVSGAGLDEAVGYAKGPSAAEPVPADVAARDYPLITAANPYFSVDAREATFEIGFEIMLDGIARMHRAMVGGKRAAKR